MSKQMKNRTAIIATFPDDYEFDSLDDMFNDMRKYAANFTQEPITGISLSTNITFEKWDTCIEKKEIDLIAHYQTLETDKEYEDRLKWEAMRRQKDAEDKERARLRHETMEAAERQMYETLKQKYGRKS